MPTEPKPQNPPIDIVLVFQMLLTLVFVLVVCYMWLSGKTPPDLLLSLTSALVGFFFGGRLQASAVRQQAAGIQALSEALK